jgi:hypothetical protein
MSKPSKRPNREERKAHKKVLAAQEALREQWKKDGAYQVQTVISNTIRAFKNLFIMFQLPIPICPNSICLKKLACTGQFHPFIYSSLLFFTSFQFFQAHDSCPAFLRASF